MKNVRHFFAKLPVKIAAGLLFILALEAIVAPVQWMANYYRETGITPDILVADQISFEEDAAFNSIFSEAAYNVLNVTRVRENFETDGKYDGDKIVDLSDYADAGVITGVTHCGISYTLDNLKKQTTIAGYGNNNQSVYVYQSDMDSTYRYSLSPLDLSVSEISDHTASKSDEADASEYSYLYNTLEIPVQAVSPQEGDWIELFNKNTILNGKMEAYSSDLRQAMEKFTVDYSVYQNRNMTSYGNMSYILTNADKSVIYSSDDAWSAANNIQTGIDAIKSMGIYYEVAADGDITTNMSSQGNGDMMLRWGLGIMNDRFSGWSLYFGVDTSYPVSDAFSEAAAAFDEYHPAAVDMRNLLIAGIAGVVLSVLLMGFSAGASEDGNVRLYGFDRLKTELAAAIIIVPVILLLCIDVTVGMVSVYYDYVIAFCILTLPAGLLFIAAYTSLLRRIKAKQLWTNSLLRLASINLWKGGKRVVSGMRTQYKQLSVTWQAAVIIVGYVLLHWMVVFSQSGFWLLIMIAVDVAAVLKAFKYITGIDLLLNGMKRITEGDLDAKLNRDDFVGPQKELADLLNHVEDGLSEAIDSKMHSERMKTELITNVSHDIKTPLTSIINYIDLLKREMSGKSPDTAVMLSYLEVLSQKADRLKSLTEDVVEASKISSGNIVYENVNLNLVELISQAEAEYADKLAERGLQVISSVPELPVVIFADGRRIWRILSNLYQNAAKYAQQGSRVYVSLQVTEEHAVYVMKNMSEAPLNISADELTERFIRGDVSRTTEGSGLGLSIAKSLADAMKGTFDIYLDGDLFKVTVSFPIQKIVDK